MKEDSLNKTHVVRATQDMVPDIIDVIKKSYKIAYKEGGPISEPYFSETYTEDVISGKIRLFVSYDDDRISGSVQYEDRNGIAFLNQMTVAPEFREKGVGAKLLSAAEKSATEEGFKVMQLTAMVEKGLPNYYDKLGYKKVGTKQRPTYLLFVMEKQLS